MVSEPSELSDILSGIVQVRPVHEVLGKLAEYARELTGADYAALGAYGEAGHLEHFEAVGLTPEERAALPHAPFGLGLLGEFAARPVPINVPEITAHPASAGFPPGHPPMGPFLGVPLRFGDETLGAFYVTRRPGSPPFTDQHQSLLEMRAPYAAILLHNARVLEAETRQREAAQVLADVAQRMQAAETRRDLAEAVVELGGPLLPDVMETVLAWTDPESPDGVETLSSEPQSVLAAKLLPLLLTAETRTALLLDELVESGGVRATVHELDDGGRLLLAMHIPRPDAFRRASAAALVDLALVGYGALLRREAHAALEKYQTRDAIARDLHDDIIQSIYAVGLGMHTARMREDISKDDALEKAMADLNVVIAELRAYISHLTGTETVTGGVLGPRLHSIFQNRTTAEWSVEIDLDGMPLDPRTERQIYLLARELISNVERHSGAANASLLIQSHDSGVRLQVTDDGRGFDPATVPPDKVGVRSIQQRVDDLDGSVVFESEIGCGTVVTIQVPLAATESGIPSF